MVIVTGLTVGPDLRKDDAFRDATTRSFGLPGGLSTPDFRAGAGISVSTDYYHGLLEALMEDKIDQQECKAIRREAFKLGDAIQLIPQTPNLILIPLRYEIASGDDESESSKSLRRLYVTLLLSIVFDASVSIRRAAEISDLGQTGGAAYVSPNPAVRSLILKEWISISEARYWLRAIGAASVLARDAALAPRSALYQALAADPAEKLVRRIEEKGRTISPLQLDLISQLPGFHAGQL